MNNYKSFIFYLTAIFCASLIFAFVNNTILKSLILVLYLLTFLYFLVSKNTRLFFPIIFLISSFEILGRVSDAFITWEFNKIALVLLSLIFYVKSKISYRKLILLIPIFLILNWILFSGDKSSLHYIYPWVIFSLLWVAVNNKNSDINIFLQKDYIFFSPVYNFSCLFINKKRYFTSRFWFWKTFSKFCGRFFS